MTVGLVMLFLAVTGALMSVQSQITSWSERSLAVATPSSACVSFASLAEKARQETAKPATSLTIYADAHSPALYTVSNDTVYLIDPCTGTLLEPGPSRVRALLLSREGPSSLGRLRRRATRVPACVQECGQPALRLSHPEWPHSVDSPPWKATNLRAVSSVRTGLKGRARDWNLHHIAGLWFSIPLLAISLSGTIMGYGWANSLLYRAAGSPVPKVAEEHVAEAPANDLSALDSLLPIAKAQDPNWKILTVRLPKESDKAVNFTIDDRLDNQPRARNLLTLSRKGKVLAGSRSAPFQRGGNGASMSASCIAGSSSGCRDNWSRCCRSWPCSCSSGQDFLLASAASSPGARGHSGATSLPA